MKNPMHFSFNIDQQEMFAVPTEEINAELEPNDPRQGDDVCEYL